LRCSSVMISCICCLFVACVIVVLL
jgi:hypothetical protein